MFLAPLGRSLASLLKEAPTHGTAVPLSWYDHLLPLLQETDLKGISETPRLPACLFLLLAIAQSSFAGTAYSEFMKPHRADASKLHGNAEVVTHRFGEYQLVEIFIPAGKVKVTVHDLQIKGTAAEAYEQIITADTVAVVGGGFYGYDKDGDETPIGLTRENGVRKVALMPWSHGGVLTSDGDGHVRIYPAKTAAQGGRWAFALQSKPIIVLNNNVDVARNLRDSDFNRVAVGTTSEGDTLIIGLFHSFGQAGTLVQLARIYKEVADQRGVMILRALAMDGGAGAQIHLPEIKKSFGDTGVSYFPNAIKFDKNSEQNNKK